MTLRDWSKSIATKECESEDLVGKLCSGGGTAWEACCSVAIGTAEKHGPTGKPSQEVIVELHQAAGQNDLRSCEGAPGSANDEAESW